MVPRSYPTGLRLGILATMTEGSGAGTMTAMGGGGLRLLLAAEFSGIAGARLEPGLRLTLAGATVAATLFAGWQLLLPRAFASFFGLSAADLVIIRLTGAATLGYALAGLLATAVDRWPAARIQTFPSISANILAAIASAIYIAQGGRSLLAHCSFLRPACSFFR